MYTLHSLNAVSISDDSTLLAAGFGSSRIKIWSLSPRKLYPFKSPAQMQQVTLAAGEQWGGGGEGGGREGRREGGMKEGGGRKREGGERREGGREGDIRRCSNAHKHTRASVVIIY